MKKLVAFALAAGMTLGAVSAANAAEGCGRGFHRSYHGRCIPNDGYRRGPGRVVVAPGGLIVGNFYQGRGYWDGHRYYQHRERYNNGWRYR